MGYEKTEHPMVYVNETWYFLSAVNDTPLKEIVVFCQKNYGSKAFKRFTEDLVQVLSQMGNPPGDKVKLSLLTLDKKEPVTLTDVEMTREKREALKHSLRKRKKEAKEKPVFISAEKIEEDLKVFEQRLEAQFAYLKTNNVDYKSAINNLRKKCGKGMTNHKFGMELQKIIGLFIDGHAGVSSKILKKGFLPFTAEVTGSRVVAVKADRSGFLAEDYPYLNKIDDLDIQYWINIADDFRAVGSHHYRFRQGVRMLRNIQYMRSLIGLEEKKTIKVELISADLTKTKTIEMKVSDKKVRSPKIKKPENGILEGNIGYLSIESFGSRSKAVPDINKWMPEFKDTKVVIIDVRDNGGGSRAGLLELYPYLMDSSEKPSVANVCAYRLFNEFKEDHLAARFAYRKDNEQWNDKERKAIEEFEKSFKPQWKPDYSEFSKWHYVLLSKREDDKKYFYNKPVIVLMDGGCFSATDIFLGALKGWKENIKLVGTPSGGGSARSVRFQLPNSKLQIRNASMISYQRTGALYDTNGIFPDFLIYPDPEYFLLKGNDNQLKDAIKIINNSIE
ncbi:MAG: S41 family peptidase [Rhodothermaceae bacterium]